MQNLSNVSEIKVQFFPEFKPLERPIVRSSKLAYQVLLSQWDEGLMQFIEEFKVFYLDAGNHVLGVCDISMGGRSSVQVDMKTIFSIALKCCASKIILAHNHPSGRLYPSAADRQITKKIITAGEYLDIEICDHIIVTPRGYCSFKDEDLL